MTTVVLRVSPVGLSNCRLVPSLGAFSSWTWDRQCRSSPDSPDFPDFPDSPDSPGWYEVNEYTRLRRYSWPDRRHMSLIVLKDD